jgi:hypothetical protein
MECGLTITSYEGIISAMFLKFRNGRGLSYKELQKNQVPLMLPAVAKMLDALHTLKRVHP